MATLIIYYSNGGTTETVAKTLAKHLRAKLLRIHDLKNRDGFKNRLFSSINAFREVKTDIIPAKVDLSEFDTVILGTPTWAGNPTPAILTIIDRCNFTRKDMILFATVDSNRGDANIGESFAIATKNKSPEKLVNDTEAIIEMKDLKMYTR